MKPCKRRGTIHQSTAERIEQLAASKMRRGKKMYVALTEAARAVLRCKPRRALPAEGSRNYIESVAGRIVWGR